MKAPKIIRTKICKICGKKITSMYPTQLNYNYKTHLKTHIKKKSAVKGGMKKNES